MSQTPFDPNRTVIGGPGPAVDPNRTQAMSGPPPMPAAGTATATELSVNVLAGRSATMANGPAREAFLLEISAPHDAGTLPGMAVAGRRAPLNLCLVIDRSGSMEGAPLQFAKEACSFVIDLLGPQDVLSIVTFDETVQTLMNPQNVTDKHAVKQGLQQLSAGYTTDLYAGMQQAAGLLLERKGAGRTTRMVVLTDGEPTSGITGYTELTEFAGNLKQQGVTCTFLGFGPEYNEELLAGMAKRATGNYYYIAQPHMIPEVFGKEINKLLGTAATNLRLSVKTARWVTLRAATGHAITPGAANVTLDLSDIEAGSTLRQGFELEFPNHPIGHYRVMAGELTYEDTGTGASKRVDVDFVVEFTADPAKYSQPMDPKVEGAMELSAASRVVERTIMGLKTQQINLATAMADLQKTQALLVQQGKTAEAQEVTIAMQAISRGDVGGAEKTLMGTVVNLDQGKSN